MSANDPNFLRFRPRFHIIAPQGWMNDPCGPCYNPKTGEYNVFFQWNPSGNNWGNISWGKAVSKDLVSWEIDGWPVLTPTEPYDCKGIFTGCVVPTGDTLTCFYTSVSHLPISHEMNYTRGSETLSVADGKTFQRHEGNPILPGPPDGLDVTGWRDPYVAQWPALDRLRGKSEGSNLYGVISGGIRSKTPTAFLYAINPEKLQEWTFLSILTNVGINSHPTHLRWSGALGKNWEVLNFVSLTDKADGTELQVLIMSVEGCDQPGHHGRRAQLWLSGELLNTVDGPQLTPSFWGRLDHGCLYAANGFWDPVAKKQLIYGWITEDDLADDNRKRQGWSGCLSFPRVASLVTLRGVMSGWVSPLDQMTHIKAEKETGGRGYIVRTLGSFPDMRVATGLRSKATKKTISSVSDSIELSSGHAWEVNIDACLEDNCGNVGIKIGNIELRFSPITETFTIIRPRASEDGINTQPEMAPHTLFRMVDGTTENLQIQAWRDQSVLEVFVNRRTAITTRVYEEVGEGEGERVRFVGDTGNVGGVKGEVWDGVSAGVIVKRERRE